MDARKALLELYHAAGVPAPMEFNEFRLTLAGYDIGVVTTNRRQADYILSVVYPHKAQPIVKATKYTVACLPDTGSRFLAWVLADSARSILAKGNCFEHGVLSCGIHYVLPIPRVFVNFISDTGEGRLLISTGQRAEWGATSFLRAALLRQYRTLPAHLIFHAASSAFLPTQQGVIFSTDGFAEGYGRSGKNKAGKTTASLATALLNRGEWALHSGDEVVTSLSGGCVTLLPLPSEFMVKTGTMRGLSGYGVDLKTVAEFRDPHGDEIVHAVTGGALAQTGFAIVSDLQNLRAWFFVDINPEIRAYEVRQLKVGEAFRAFCGSIFRRRMAESRAPLYEPEYDIGGFMKPLQPGDFVTARNTFCSLWQEGTKFVSLRGGVDYYKLVCSIKGALCC